MRRKAKAKSKTNAGRESTKVLIVSPGLHKKVKLAADRKDLTMQAWTRKAINQYIRG